MVLSFGGYIVDEIIEEPAGGAHRQPVVTAHLMREAVARHFSDLRKLSIDDMLDQRYRKHRAIGEVAASYGADEVLIVTNTFDHAARLRSFQLIAQAFGAPGSAS